MAARSKNGSIRPALEQRPRAKLEGASSGSSVVPRKLPQRYIGACRLAEEGRYEEARTLYSQVSRKSSKKNTWLRALIENDLAVLSRGQASVLSRGQAWFLVFTRREAENQIQCPRNWKCGVPGTGSRERAPCDPTQGSRLERGAGGGGGDEAARLGRYPSGSDPQRCEIWAKCGGFRAFRAAIGRLPEGLPSVSPSRPWSCSLDRSLNKNQRLFTRSLLSEKSLIPQRGGEFARGMLDWNDRRPSRRMPLQSGPKSPIGG